MTQIDLVDTNFLNEAAGHSTAMVRELVKIYLKQARQILDRLSPAVQAAAALDVEFLAHKLAGSSAACGITGLVSPLQTLEQLGRVPKFAKPEAEELLRSIQEKLAQAETLLYAYCDSLPGAE